MVPQSSGEGLRWTVRHAAMRRRLGMGCPWRDRSGYAVSNASGGGSRDVASGLLFPCVITPLAVYHYHGRTKAFLLHGLRRCREPSDVHHRATRQSHRLSPTKICEHHQLQHPPCACSPITQTSFIRWDVRCRGWVGGWQGQCCDGTWQCGPHSLWGQDHPAWNHWGGAARWVWGWHMSCLNALLWHGYIMSTGTL